MKKIVLVLACCLAVNTAAFALTDVQKTKIAAKRQVYSTQRRAVNNQLETARADYIKVSESTTMSAAAKEKKLKELENKIVRLNQEKERLRKQYQSDKKAIKRQG